MGGTDLEVRRVVNGASDLLGSWRLQASDEVELTTESRETHPSPAAGDGEPGHQLVRVVTITSRDEDVVSEAEIWPGTIVKARGEEGDRNVEIASESAQARSDADAEAETEADVEVPLETPVESPSVEDMERHPTKGEVKDEEAAEAALADDEEGDTGSGPYEGRTNDQLRQLCAERGLATGGNKDELIERLRA